MLKTKTERITYNMAKILTTALVLCHAALAFAAWTDISGAIAAREAAWTPVATGVSSDQSVGALAADEGSAEFVSGGRVFDTLFWYEAFSAPAALYNKSRPGITIMVW